jgi:hypothetical protein
VKRSGSQWLYVCGGASPHTADLLCQQLGFNTLHYSPTTTLGKVTGSMQTHLTCPDTATSLSVCTTGGDESTDPFSSAKINCQGTCRVGVCNGRGSSVTGSYPNCQCTCIAGFAGPLCATRVCIPHTDCNMTGTRDMYMSNDETCVCLCRPKFGGRKCSRHPLTATSSFSPHPFTTTFTLTPQPLTATLSASLSQSRTIGDTTQSQTCTVSFASSIMSNTWTSGLSITSSHTTQVTPSRTFTSTVTHTLSASATRSESNTSSQSLSQSISAPSKSMSRSASPTASRYCHPLRHSGLAIEVINSTVLTQRNSNVTARNAVLLYSDAAHSVGNETLDALQTTDVCHNSRSFVIAVFRVPREVMMLRNTAPIVFNASWNVVDPQVQLWDLQQNLRGALGERVRSVETGRSSDLTVAYEAVAVLPPGMWLRDVGVFEPKELLINVTWGCGGDPVHDPTYVLNSAQIYIVAQEYTSTFSNAVGSVVRAALIGGLSGPGSSTAIGRTSVARSVALCNDVESVVGLGPAKALPVASFAWCSDAREVAVQGRSAILWLLFAVALTAALMSCICVAYWRRGCTATLVAAFAMIGMPSSLLPVAMVFAPSAAASSLYLFMDLSASDCPVSDVALGLVGIVLSLLPVATLTTAAYYCRVALVCVDSPRCDPSGGVLRSFAWRLFRRRRRWKDASSCGGGPLRWSRIGTVVLLEYASVGYAALDVTVLLFCASVALLTTLETSTACSTAGSVMLVVYLGQFAICAYVQPFTTIFGFVQALCSLALNSASICFQMGHLLSSRSAESVELSSIEWMLTAAGVCDLLIVVISVCKMSVDFVELARAAYRRLKEMCAPRTRDEPPTPSTPPVCPLEMALLDDVDLEPQELMRTPTPENDDEMVLPLEPDVSVVDLILTMEEKTGLLFQGCGQWQDELAHAYGGVPLIHAASQEQHEFSDWTESTEVIII